MCLFIMKESNMSENKHDFWSHMAQSKTTSTIAICVISVNFLITQNISILFCQKKLVMKTLKFHTRIHHKNNLKFCIRILKMVGEVTKFT